MKSLKIAAIILAICAVGPIYVYGFTHFKTIDILIPAGIISLGGFVLLGCVWLYRYSGKEINR